MKRGRYKTKVRLVNSQTVKRCSQCGIDKPLTEFYRESKAPDGRRGNCKACKNGQVRQYRVDHFEKLRDYDQNRHKRIAKDDLPRKQAYRASHPEQAKIHTSRRRAHKLGNGGELTTEQFAVICAAQHGRCAKCGKKRSLTIDHVIPLSKGGAHSPDNVQGLCRHCNAVKFTKDTDYRKALPLPLWQEGKIIP